MNKRNNRLINTVVLCLSTVFMAQTNGAEYYVNLYNANGFYMWAYGGGGGPASGSGIPRGKVMDSQTYPPNRFADWILNDINGGTLESGDQVSLRTGANGLFMCAEAGGGTIVVANRVFGGGWETFTIHKVSGSGSIGNNDNIALQASNGQFLCAEQGGGIYIIADRNGIGAWETFSLQIRWVGPPYWSVSQYDPYHWNDFEIDPEMGTASSIQWNNNCYNYGANRQTNSYAQPGRASGQTLTAPVFTLGQIVTSLINDGWEPADAYTPCPEGKMRVFVALYPTVYPFLYQDYHLYRQDVYGTNWSHKPGASATRDYDWDFNPITNPETSNRWLWTHDVGYWFIPTFNAQGVGYANIY